MISRPALAALFFAGFLAWGCAPRSPGTPERVPVRWIMVEKRVGELLPDGHFWDGQVDPGAKVLTLQPLYREDLSGEVVVDPREDTVEVLEISPPGRASPGETVTATVRVAQARKGERYRLSARPLRADIRMIGQTDLVVAGDAPAVFRFTSASIGRGGIAVGVERIRPASR
jgi:hypothetical protein